MKHILMKLLGIFFFTVPFLILACGGQNTCFNCGVVLTKNRIYDSITNQYNKTTIIPDFKIWYKDSFVIQEIKEVNINTDAMGITTIKTPISHYIFMDLRFRSFYHYKTFSDTASIIEKYTQPDSVELRGTGGWRFYTQRDLPLTEPPQFMGDTMISGIVYKRVKLLNFREGALNPVAIGYLRCDKKETFFQFDINLSKKSGCPLVRLDYLPTPEEPFPTSASIEFISDTLTKEEIKVFESWEKNAKNNPVKR